MGNPLSGRALDCIWISSKLPKLCGVLSPTEAARQRALRLRGRAYQQRWTCSVAAREQPREAWLRQAPGTEIRGMYFHCLHTLPFLISRRTYWKWSSGEFRILLRHLPGTQQLRERLPGQTAWTWVLVPALLLTSCVIPGSQLTFLGLSFLFCSIGTTNS